MWCTLNHQALKYHYIIKNLQNRGVIQAIETLKLTVFSANGSVSVCDRLC